jgi:hypothetical protein
MISDKENAGVNPNVMLFSPPKALKGSNASGGLGGVRGGKESVPCLSCAKFCGDIVINFDKVDVNSTNSRKFKLMNPDQEKEVVIEVDTALESKGFSVVLGNGDSSLRLAANGKGEGVVTWTPKTNMTVSKKLHLKLNGEKRLQIKVNGIAGTGKVSILDTHRRVIIWHAAHFLTRW